MSGLTIGVAAAVGLVGGAAVPLVAYRLAVPAGEPVRSTCVHCALPLARGMAGWVHLPARCGQCGGRLGPLGWLTAAVATGASGLVAAALGPVPELALFVALCVVAVLLAAVDLACMRLPHFVVVPAIWFSGAAFAAVAAATGEWEPLIRAALGAVALGAAFLVLFLMPGGGLGYGDVKLAVLLGLFLGWLGWPGVVLGGVLPWIVNAPMVIALLLTGRLGRKSTIPFGPAMLGGALLAVLAFTWLGAVSRF